MLKTKGGRGTWLSPWPDSSWRPTRPSLGWGRPSDPLRPPLLQDRLCRPCRGWTEPGCRRKPPPSLIQVNCTSPPITTSTSCLLGPPPPVRTNTTNPLGARNAACSLINAVLFSVTWENLLADDNTHTEPFRRSTMKFNYLTASSVVN